MSKQLSEDQSRIHLEFSKYLIFLQTNDWREKEAYKFEYANWLTANTSVEKDKPAKILCACQKSQVRSYSQGSGPGIQFLRKAGRKKLSDFIGAGDIRIFKAALAQDGQLTEEDCRSRTISYTALSGWLGTLLPNLFVPAPTTDFAASFEYLFDLNKVRRKDFAAFIQYQQRGKLVMAEIEQLPDLEWLYLNHINSFRTSVKLKPKSKYDAYDRNWIMEDFLLYIHRVKLQLRPIDYLTDKIFGGHDLEEVNIRAWRHHYAVVRDSEIVRKMKSTYNYQCQICGKGSEISPQSFVEGAHIKPLGGEHNGNDSSDNLLCLCPNHHSLFDLGAFYIDQNLNTVGLGANVKLTIHHKVNMENLDYHRREVYDVAQKAQTQDARQVRL